MISALMTMTKKRPSPIVCHLDKHSQWGPCSWRKKNPSNVNRTSCKKKKKYLSKECFMRKLPCLGLAMHFVKKGGISVSVSLSFPPSVSTSSEPGSQVPTICATLSSPEGNLAGGNELSWAFQRISISSIFLEVSLTPVCLVQHEAVPRPSLHEVFSSSSWHQNKNILSALLLDPSQSPF